MPEVVFLGTSDAFGAGGRRQTSILVRTEQGTVLLDCGPTTNTALADLGIHRDEIDAIILSHFHGDHFGGVPLLLLGARYEDDRRKPIRIAGPEGVERRVTALAEAMSHRVDRWDWSYPILYTEYPTGVEIPVGPVRVRGFRVHHNEDVNPHGLDILADGKRIVFSGDTGWFDRLPDEVGEADLFICECNFDDRNYEHHLNYRTLRARKAEFRARRMIITHLSEEMAHLRGRCDFETADDGLRIKL